MNDNSILIYQDENEVTRVAVHFADEDLWVTQAQLAEVYCTTPQNITMHIANIYKDAELEQVRTCKDFLLVRQEGRRKVQRKATARISQLLSRRPRLYALLLLQQEQTARSTHNRD